MAVARSGKQTRQATVRYTKRVITAHGQSQRQAKKRVIDKTLEVAVTVLYSTSHWRRKIDFGNGCPHCARRLECNCFANFTLPNNCPEIQAWLLLNSSHAVFRSILFQATFFVDHASKMMPRLPQLDTLSRPIRPALHSAASPLFSLANVHNYSSTSTNISASCHRLTWLALPRYCLARSSSFFSCLSTPRTRTTFATGSSILHLVAYCLGRRGEGPTRAQNELLLQPRDPMKKFPSDGEMNLSKRGRGFQYSRE